MKGFRTQMEENWLYMIRFPWQDVDIMGYSKRDHIATWITGWLWAISGIIAGSLFSFPIISVLHVQATPYEGVASISIAVVFGFAVQLIGWFVIIVLDTYETVFIVVYFIVMPPISIAYIILAVVAIMSAIVKLFDIKTGFMANVVDTFGNLKDAIPLPFPVILLIVILCLFIFESVGVISGRNHKTEELGFESRSYIYGIVVVIPALLSVFYIYWFFKHAGADFGVASRNAEYAFIIKLLGTLIFPAFGKLLTILGIFFAVLFGRKNKKKANIS